MNQTSPQWPRRRNRRGVSLLEILVVLAILVVGILAIIRLFPSGFFSIESVGNTALADTLGSAALDTQAQNATGLPGAILANVALVDSQYSSSDYDQNVEPDFSKTLDRSRTVQDETVAVPAQKTGNSFKCVYVVSYGPFRYGSYRLSGEIVNSPATNPTVNSAYWQDVSGSSVATVGAPAIPQEDLQDDLVPRQERVLVDYADGKLAIPYARTYSQACTVLIQATNKVTGQDQVYTLGFTVPASGSSPTVTDPHQPNDPAKFLADGQSYYNGGWFDPAQAMTDPADNTKTYKYNTDAAPAIPPTPWKNVMLYRPYAYVAGATSDAAFSSDPYQYATASPDVVDGNGGAVANLGAIAFNPLGAGGQGVKPLRARVSYLSYGWRVLHEDRDVPTITVGSGTTTRLTLKNLKKVGDPQSDNTIFAGLIAEAASPQKDLYFLNLDTGQTLTTPVNDEDANGTVAADINVSYATGRITFPAGTSASRVRIFYAGDQDWTVAVQKAPDFYTRDADTTSAAPVLDAAHCAFGLDPVSGNPCLFFPRCDAGKTVEVDGLVAYDTANKSYACPSITAAIGDVPVPRPGGGAVELDLGTTIKSALGNATLATTGGSPISFTAVRGLSARAVVAWTERGRWKVHVVDTVLSRPQ